VKTSTFFRCMLAFWLEAQLIAAVLLLIGVLPVRFTDAALFSLTATLLLSAGGWLYHGGGIHRMLHLLLYPLVGGIAVLASVALDSWLIGLLLAGVYFWRIHTVVTIRLYHHDLLRRFILALFGNIFHLVYLVMFVSLYRADAPDYRELYALFTLLLVSYIVVGWGEFLTREKPAGVSLTPPMLARMGGQLLAAKALLAAGYGAAAAVALSLLTLLWTLVKTPVGQLMYAIFLPVLEWIAYLVSRLAVVLDRDGRLNQLNNGEGSGEQLAEELAAAQGETLFSMLQPYLTGLFMLVFVFWLIRKIWQRRYTAEPEPSVSAQTPTAVALSPLAQTDADSSGMGSRLRSLLNEWMGPKDDRVRYLYVQFLRYMASQGIRIQPHETSHEFVRRIQSLWNDPNRIALAVRITDCYEQYRYTRKPLAPEEMAAMESCVKALRGQ